jgi:outer membrane protein assembly factor BamB
MSRASVFLLAALLSPSVAFADNWPAWRGPAGNGECKETNLPVKWSPTQNITWKVDLPDEGNSTPVIWNDRIFLTQATEKGRKRSIICFAKKDGKKLWEKTVEYAEDEPTHKTNPYCSASPVTDGERVIVSHGSAGLFCYDFAGKELWRKDLGKCHHVWGNAASPVIYQDRVFLNFGPGERTFLIALDKRDGKELWRVNEPGKPAKEYFGSWSTPLLATIHSRDELIVSWPGVVKSYGPKTGEVFWSCRGLEKDKSADRLVYTSPLATEEVVVSMAGYGGPSIALKTGGKGDVTESLRLWRHPNNPQRIGSGVVVGEHVYVVNEPGTAQCIEWQTGKIFWNERVGAGAWGSLLHADGKLYVTNLDGETFILAAKPEFEIIARNPLKERTLASIAVSDGRLLIRTYKHLWCVGK